MIEKIFSRFQTLVDGLKVMSKGYTTSDHVKKIIKCLPKKWRPMVTALKVSKDLNTTLEELISSLKSHEIDLEEDEPKKKIKPMDLEFKGKFEKAKALQTKEEESEESSEEEYDTSLLSIRVNQL